MATAVTTTPTTTSTNGTTTAPTTAVGQNAKGGQYRTTTEYKKPAPVLQMSTDLVFLAYDLKPEMVAEFREFYEKNIERWMRRRHVRHAHGYMIGSTFVVLASIQADVPWILNGDEQPSYGVEPIEGFADYLANEQPEVTKLSAFSNPTPR